MNEPGSSREEARMLRWGGIAGMLGSLVLIVVFGIVIAFVGADPAEPEGLVIRHPDIRAARVAENGLYMLALVLWSAHVLALYRALRATQLAPALYGVAAAICGLVLLMAGALVHVATDPIANLYHASNATSDDRAALVLIWQATQGVFDALLVTGLLLAPLGVALFGYAMRGEPRFGRRAGTFSSVLGVLGFLAATTLLVNVSEIAVVTVFALIVFNAIGGWSLYRLAGEPIVQVENAVSEPAFAVETR